MTEVTGRSRVNLPYFFREADGVVVFETDTPYLLSDGVALQPPLPVVIVDGPVFADSMGNAQRALGVSGLPEEGEPE